MSQQPRPESRITSLENRASTIEAQIVEMSKDTAEELKAIRQDIKKLDDGIIASYVSIGDTFIATWNDIKATLATKEDITKVETRLDKIETTMVTKDDMAAMETRIIDTFTQLLQKKSGEE